MKKGRVSGRGGIRSLTLIQLYVLSHFLYRILFPSDLLASENTPFQIPDKSDFMDIYDPGIPKAVSFEWDLPSGISLGISGGHQVQQVSESIFPAGYEPKMNLFPLSFLMKIPLYETKRLSQSMGFGIGPCFLHQGSMPIQFSDFEVLGMSTFLTEWVTHISKDLYLNLKMKYTQAFQSMENRIPTQDFSTFLGLNARW